MNKVPRATIPKQWAPLKEERFIESKRRRTLTMNSRRRSKEATHALQNPFMYRYTTFCAVLIILGWACYGICRQRLSTRTSSRSQTNFNLLEDRLPTSSETFLHDFASRRSGGKVLLELTTPPFKQDKRNGPTAVIDEDLNPGKCWVIDGSSGQIGIHFSEAISITHITIEHVAKELVDKVVTAPKKMLIWGFTADAFEASNNLRKTTKIDLKGPGISSLRFSFLLLATLQYEIASSNNRQTYLLRHPHMMSSFEGVVVEVVENWGGDTTCLYGIRVHGSKSRRSILFD